MRRTIIITTGWCGFGRTTGLWNELRLGIVAVGWCRGSLRENVAAMLEQHYRTSNEAMKALLARINQAMKGDDK